MNNKTFTIKFILLSILIVFIGIFFINNKKNIDFDEIGTYGLSNNTFELTIDNNKTYSGNELLINYSAVKLNNRFNFKNVIFNQSNDTHPPLYYILIHIICSLFPNKFSIWYGLSLNIIFLVIMFWQMNYLFNIIINDNTMSALLSLSSIFLYGFINEIVFTRMYLMLSIISMSFIIIIINKLKHINNQNENSIIFLLKLYFICLIGILTHYHFFIVASFFSVYFLINLIINKKYKLFLLSSISGILSITTSMLLFKKMINHIFGGGNSMHSLNTSQNVNLIERFIEMFNQINKSFFGNYIYIYLIIIILCFIYILFKIKTNKNPNFNYLINTKYYFIFLLFSIYYYLFICITIRTTFMRYFYNILPILTICFITPIYFVLKNINNKLKYLSICVVLLFSILRFGIQNDLPFSLHKTEFEEEYLNYLKDNQNLNTIVLYNSFDENKNFNTSNTSKWKLPKMLYDFRLQKKIQFIDYSEEDKFYNNIHLSNDEKDTFLIIFRNANDEQLIKTIANQNNFYGHEIIYKSLYYNLYKLVK